MTQDSFFFFHNYTPVVRPKGTISNPSSPLNSPQSSPLVTRDRKALDTVTFERTTTPCQVTTTATPCTKAPVSLSSRNQVFDISKKVISRPPSARSTTNDELFPIARPASVQSQGILSTPISRRTSSMTPLPLSPPTPLSIGQKEKKVFDSITSNSSSSQSMDFFSGPTLTPCSPGKQSSESSVGLFARFSSPKPPSSQAFAPTFPRPPRPASLSKPPSSSLPPSTLVDTDSDDEDIEAELAKSRQRLLKQVEEEKLKKIEGSEGLPPTLPPKPPSRPPSNSRPKIIIRELSPEPKVTEPELSKSPDISEPIKNEVVEESNEPMDQEPIIPPLPIQNHSKSLSNLIVDVNPSVETPDTSFEPHSDDESRPVTPINQSSSPELAQIPSDSPTFAPSSLMNFCLSPGRGSRVPPINFSSSSSFNFESDNEEDKQPSDWVKSVLQKVVLSDNSTEENSRKRINTTRHVVDAPPSPVSKLLQSNLINRNLPSTDDYPSYVPYTFSKNL
ncbi:hypothetical protein RCL1_004408 [Eukaryota sp. TZLM3-RCL]